MTDVFLSVLYILSKNLFFFSGWFLYNTINGWSEQTIMYELLCLYGNNNSQIHAH